MTAPALAYRQTPKPIGHPVSFDLRGDRLLVDNGRKLREVRLGAVREVRLSYQAGGIARRVFRTRLALVDGRSVAFTSVTWSSMIEARPQDEAYRAFVAALLDAVARANPQARFVAGRPLLAWASTAGLGILVILGLGVFLWRAFEAKATGAALLGGFMGAAGLWQLAPLVLRNRPRAFAAGAPPADVLP